MTSRREGTIIVGAGLMGRWHSHAVHAIGGRIAAIVDSDAMRASVLARHYGALVTADIERALATAPFAVHICTPATSHSTLAMAALDAGAHVLVEKPFAPATETRAILDRARTARLIACPVHQVLFQRGMQRAFTALDRFGPIIHADFVACSAGADGTPDRRRQLALDILPHSLSVLRRFWASPLDVSGWHVTATAPGEVRISGDREGVTVGILISAGGRPTSNAARLIGARGTAHIDLFHGFSVLEPPSVSRAQKIIAPFRRGLGTVAAATTNLALRTVRREPAYPGLRELIAGFYDAARRGAGSPISSEETLDVALATEHFARLIAGT